MSWVWELINEDMRVTCQSASLVHTVVARY